MLGHCRGSRKSSCGPDGETQLATVRTCGTVLMLDLAGAPIARSITAWHCHVFDNVRAPPIADSSMLYTDRNCPSTEAETRPAGAPPRAWCVFACDATNSARYSHLTPTCAAAGLTLLRDNSIHERSNTHLLLEVAGISKDPAHVVGRSSKRAVS